MFRRPAGRKLFDYRFIFLDFVLLMRNNERIRKHYAQSSLIRKQEYKEAMQQLIKSKIMREEELSQEYDFLYQRFHILAGFWLS